MVVPSHSTLTIGNVYIRQDEAGRYCLNDLHKAAGNIPKHKPSEWLRNKQTIELIQEMSKAGIPALEQNQAVVTQRGGNAPGTYIAKELVYAYANKLTEFL